MKEKTIQALNSWLNQHPKSYHSCDMDRFYNFIKVAADNNDLREVMMIDLENYLRNAQPSWCDEAIDKFVEEWTKKIELCAGLMLHLAGKNF